MLTKWAINWARKARGRYYRRFKPWTLTGLETITPISRRFGRERGTPIDRYYIESFLQSQSASVKGDAIEIAEDTYIRRFGGDRINKTYILAPTTEVKGANLIVDLTQVPDSQAGIADCFICTQTLNFIYDLKAAVEGIHKLLKPGGTALITVAGISQISPNDDKAWGDFWRFTPRSAEKVIEGVFGKPEYFECYGNLSAAVAFLMGASQEDLKDKSCLDGYDGYYPVIMGIKAVKK